MFIRTDENHNIITYPYSLEQFRADHRNISFPSALSNRLLASYNVYPVYAAPEPEYNTITQFLRKDFDNPFRDDQGEWKIGWIVVDKTSEQMADDLKKRRQEFREEINAARDAAIYKVNNVAVNETTTVPVDIRKDHPDIQNISGLAQAATLQLINNDPATIDFRGADDLIYTLTPQEVIILGKTIASNYSAHYRTSWNYKDQLAQATSIEEINSIVLDF